MQFLIVQFVAPHEGYWLQVLHSVLEQLEPVQTLLTHEALQLKGQEDIEQLDDTHDVPVQFLIVQLPDPHYSDWEQVLHSVLVQLAPWQIVLLQRGVHVFGQVQLIVWQVEPVQFFMVQLETPHDKFDGQVLQSIFVQFEPKHAV